MGGSDKRIVPVLCHARREPRRECFDCRVEVAQHHVAAPPAHKADHFFVNARREEGHSAAVPH